MSETDTDTRVEHALTQFTEGGSLAELAAALGTVATAGRGYGFASIGGAATAFAVLALANQVQRVADALEAGLPDGGKL